MTSVMRRGAFATWGVLIALGIAAQALTLLNRATWTSLFDAFGIGFSFAVTYGLAGALILSRRHGNPVGRAFLFVAAVAVTCQLVSEYGIYAYAVAHADLPLRGLAAWISQWIFFVAFPAGFSLIFLFFPEGLPSGRIWKPVIGLVVVGACLLTLGFLAADGPISPSDHGNGNYFLAVQNPTGFLGSSDNGAASVVQTIGWLTSGVALILSVGAIVVRLVRERGERREQLKWVAYLAAPVAPAFGFHMFDLAVLNGSVPDVTQPVYIFIFIAGIPAAMAISILKYRLYDIDLVISRSLVYGALAAFITAVYVGIVVGVGTLVGSGGQPNLLLSIVATAIVALGFQPVRERLQRVANRLVYGKRATPYEVLSEFSERVAETYAADEALPRMAKVLAEGTGAERAEVWLRGGQTLRAAAAWPAEANGRTPVAVTGQVLPAIPDSDRSVAVRHQGELLGALTVTKRTGEPLTPIEQKLLDDLAHQAGLVLKNVGLTAELVARLEDLRASRQRLVAAQDEERRKLERNLHDGAQQNLVALKVKLGLAEMVAEKDPERAKTLIGELKGDTDETLETLRDLARGIYPPMLAEKGLTAALEAQARKATLPVEVEAMGVGRYPQEIEAAVYFFVLEALQNAQKYADATSAAVRMTASSTTLDFEVADDGRGFDPATVQRGAGTTNMADRLDALGGQLTLTSAPGAGTRVSGRLPVSQTAP